jgi:hypothetical protein
MNFLEVQGIGVVSPAGWGLESFREAMRAGKTLPVQDVERPGWEKPLRARRVPAPQNKPAFLAQPRLRRTSPISHYAVAAALEALGNDAELVRAGQLRLGIILCVMSGCVNYSRRFYHETLRDPATASPLVFPETVFNAPASHLGALLGTTAINYTLVGDPGSFLQGVVVASDWLAQDLVDGCVVIGAEEIDWLTADAFRLFTRRMVIGDGAGALYLRSGGQEPGNGKGRGDGAGRGYGEGRAVRVGAVSDAWLFTQRSERAQAVGEAAEEARRWAGGSEQLHETMLSDGLQDVAWLDQPEEAAWRQWTGPRLSPRRVLGEGLMAGAAWQCVAAVDALRQGASTRAIVPLCGINEHVMWAGFERDASPPAK